MTGKVIHVSSQAEFDRHTRQNTTKLAVIDWTAKWCGPCQRIAPIYEQLAAKYPDVDFLKIDVDECADLAQNNGVRSMPTFHFWKGGQKAQEFSGADPNKLESTIVALRPAPSFGGSGQALGTGGGSGRSRLLDLAPPPGAARPTKPLTAAERRALEMASREDDAPPARPAAAAAAPPAPRDDEDTDLQAAIRMSMQESGPPKPAEAAAPAPTPMDAESTAAAPGEGGAAAAPAAPAPAQKLPVNETFLATLKEMGFAEVRAGKGLLATGNKSTEAAMEWIFQHMEDPDIDEPWTFEGTDGGSVPTGPKQDDRPLEVRKREFEEKLAEVRKKKAEQEAAEALERERARREAGRKAIEEAKVLKDEEMRRELEKRKKEKQDDAAYRLKLREELKRDKEERAKKEAERRGIATPPAAAPAPAPAAAAAPKPAAGPAKEYSEAVVQIRLLDGTTVRETFKPTDTLRAAARVVQGRHAGPFSLVNRSAFPPKTYSAAELDSVTMQAAGLVPSGTLVVSK